MLSDLIACLIIYYLFFSLENPTETLINTFQPTEAPLDDWESESAGGVDYQAPLRRSRQASHPDHRPHKPLFTNLLLLNAVTKFRQSTRNLLILTNKTGDISNLGPFVIHFLPRGETPKPILIRFVKPRNLISQYQNDGKPTRFTFSLQHHRQG